MASTAVAPAVKEQQLSKKEFMERMDRMEAHMEKASKPAGRIPFVGGFGGQQGNDWPTERLMHLAKSYNHEAVTQLLAKDAGGRVPRGIGWGPALRKMVALDVPSSGIAAPPGYNQESLEKEFGFATAEKASTVGIKGPTGEYRKAALAESSGVTGGYLIPPQYIAEIQTITMEDSIIEPRARVIPMNSRSMSLPMLDITSTGAAGITPYAGGVVGQWQPEAQSIAETEPVFRLSEWTAWDLVLYTVSSNQLLQDNGVGLDAFLTKLLTDAMTWYKEFAFLRGRGAGNSMPLGVINAGATYNQTRGGGAGASTFDIRDVASMFSRLHMKSWDSACWMMHQSVLPKLMQMYAASSSSDRLVWLSPIGDGKSGPLGMKMPRALFNGLPLYFTEKLPQLSNTGDVCLIDWSYYVIGKRMEIQIDVSKDFLFRTNQLAWRVIVRCDGRPWLNNTITDAANFTISPFVILV